MVVVVADDAHDSRLLYDVNGLKTKLYTHVGAFRMNVLRGGKR